MTELIVVCSMYAATLGMWAWREYRHDAERRELYNRLMARDLTEYTASSSSRPPPRARSVIAAGVRRHMERQHEAGD